MTVGLVFQKLSSKKNLGLKFNTSKPLSSFSQFANHQNKFENNEMFFI